MQIFVFKFRASSSLIFCVSMRTLSNHFWQHGMYLCTDDLFPNWIFQLCYTKIRFFAFIFLFRFFPRWTVAAQCVRHCTRQPVHLLDFSTLDLVLDTVVLLLLLLLPSFVLFVGSCNKVPFFRPHISSVFFLLVGGFLHENFVIKLLLVWSYKFAAQFSLECGLAVFGWRKSENEEWK